MSARLFLCGCAAASFLSKLPFHPASSCTNPSPRLSRPAAGQLLLLLLSRLMLLRPAAAAAAQLLLTHCHLAAAEKQLEQSEVETQKSHSSELAKLSRVEIRFLRISGSRSNSQSTVGTCWQMLGSTRQL